MALQHLSFIASLNVWGPSPWLGVCPKKWGRDRVEDEEFYLIALWGVDFMSVLQKANICPQPQWWWGLPGGSDGKESACSAGDPGLISGEGDWLPTPAVLPGEFHGQRILAGYIQSMGSQRVERDWMTNTFTVMLLIATVGFSDFLLLQLILLKELLR